MCFKKSASVGLNKINEYMSLLLQFLYHFKALTLPFSVRVRHDGTQRFCTYCCDLESKTQHFSLVNQEEQIEKYLGFIVPVHQVLFRSLDLLCRAAPQKVMRVEIRGGRSDGLRRPIHRP